MFALIIALAGFAWTCYQFTEVGLSHFGPQSVVFNLVYLVAVLQLLLVGWMLAVCMKVEEEVAKIPKMVKRYVWVASYAGATKRGSTFNGRTFASSKKKDLSPKDIECIERYVLASNPDFQAIALQSICFLSYQSIVEGATYGLD
jgi:hypothetical protein